MTGPFTGVRVVEFAQGVAGPYCGRLLAGLGADVIKVEPEGGDASRRAGPFPGDIEHPERSGLFLHLNTGKRSIVDGTLARDELFRWADVVLLSGRPSELRANEIWPADVLGKYPHLVVVATTLFGLTGPNADFLGSELVAYAASGYMSLTGEPSRPPTKAYGDLIQYQAGGQTALGVAAALAAQERDGRGQLVDVSIVEAGTFLFGGAEQPAYFFGRVAKRNGTRLTGLPPQQPYPSTIRPCRDGYVHTHSNNRHADLMHALIPNPRLIASDVLAEMTGHADEIDAIMDEWLKDRDRVDIVREAQELRLPFTEVMLPGEVMADAHHLFRKSFVEVDHPGAGLVKQPGAPIRFTMSQWIDAPAPMLGGDIASVAPSVAEQAARAPVPAFSGFRARPLSGYRVVDFTNAIAGPISTFILADLGAEVIKVEAPNARSRRPAGTAPPAPGANPDRHWNRNMVYNAVNHAKKSVSLDVNRREGRALLFELVAKSDVIVQNFSPRALDNMNLHYDAVRAANDRLIYVSMPAFGLSGPYRDRAAYGPGVDAMSGLSHLTGYADGPPSKPGNFFCDQNAGVHAAFATIAALRHRERTGEGQHVELSMIEGEFQILGDAYIDFSMNGRERRRCGNDHDRFAPHDVFPCREDDSWVAIGVETDGQWRALCQAIGRPELIDDPRYSTGSNRFANRSDFAAIISPFTQARTDYACQSLLQAAGVPAAAVLNVVQVLNDGHVDARHGLEFVETLDVGPTPYPRVAFRLSETPVPVRGPGPAFASANEEVFCGLLGHSRDELEELERNGVCPSTPGAVIAR